MGTTTPWIPNVQVLAQSKSSPSSPQTLLPSVLVDRGDGDTLFEDCRLLPASVVAVVGWQAETDL